MKPSHQIERGLLVDEVDAAARRLSGPLPPTLFHYTGHVGLLGIVDSGGVFLSDARFLNDASEVKHGRALVLELLRRRGIEHGAPEVRQGIARVIERVEADGPRRTGRFYVASFCQNGNLLSQWRAYSQPSSGYAIGFDSPELQKNAEKFSSGLHFYRQLRLRRVLYSADEQSELALKTVELFLFWATTFIGLDEAESAATLADFLETILGFVSPQMKHPLFSEEQEWRLVGINYGWSPDGPLRFRATGNGLVPYVLCALSDPLAVPKGLLPIKEICHGPSEKMELHMLATGELLHGRGYKGVVLAGSDIPLRSS